MRTKIKIYYNEKGVKKDIQDILQDLPLEAEIEYREGFDKLLQRAQRRLIKRIKIPREKRKETPHPMPAPGMGVPIPPGWIDFGVNTITWVLNHPVEIVVSNLFYDVIKKGVKKSFSLLKRKGRDKTLAVITDKFSEYKQPTIYFRFYSNQSSEEINRALNELGNFREKLITLLKLINISISTINVEYKNGEWFIIDENWYKSYSSPHIEYKNPVKKKEKTFDVLNKNFQTTEEQINYLLKEIKKLQNELKKMGVNIGFDDL